MIPPAGKLLVALQYCANDATEAFDLVNLILDLRHNTMTEPCWELLFYHAPDAPEPPADLQRKLDHKEIVWSSEDSGVTVSGWPMAPNATWQNLVHLLISNPGIHPECQHVLCAEPDSSPMRRDWAEALFAEHLLGVEQGFIFSGHKTTTAVGTLPHVNGNLIFDRKGLDKLPTELYQEMLKETEVPWDVKYSSIIVPRAYDNKMLHSSWRGEIQDSTYAWELDKFAGPCAWLHGFKGGNLRSEVRRRLLQPHNKMCRNITIYSKGIGNTQEELLSMFPDAALICGDYIEAIKEWAERGGLLIKSPAQDMEDFMHGITDALYRLKWPRFMCARHPDNQPLHLKFCGLADTTVLYTVPGNALARKLAAECVTEAQVSQMIANDPAVTWAPQGLWEPQDLPEPEIPRFVVLQNLNGVWHIVRQTDDRFEALKSGGRSRWSGKTMLVDTLHHRTQQMHSMPEVGNDKMPDEN